jgi:hypothetical protein
VFGITSDGEETISQLMHRVRLLVIKSYPSKEYNQRTLFPICLVVLDDKQLATILAVAKIE